MGGFHNRPTADADSIRELGMCLPDPRKPRQYASFAVSYRSLLTTWNSRFDGDRLFADAAYFLNEPADLQYYLKTATEVEYSDAEIESLAETTESAAPI